MIEKIKLSETFKLENTAWAFGIWWNYQDTIVELIESY